MRGLFLLLLAMATTMTPAVDDPPEDGAPLNSLIEGLSPLEGALWKGVLNLKVDGQLRSHFHDNEKTNSGKPVGFTREKAFMDLDFMLQIHFLVNSLGEFTLLATERFDGSQNLSREFRKVIQTEETVKKTRLKVTRTIQEAHKSESEITFNRDESYDQDSFELGNFIITPSGQMDKKGTITIDADFDIRYNGTGSRTLTKERQPPTPEYGRIKKVYKIKKSWRMPLSFNLQIQHRKKPVQGKINFEAPFTNPFESKKDEEGRQEKKIFTKTINVQGSYALEPLFGKKKKRKR